MTCPFPPTDFERALFARLCGDWMALPNLANDKLNWLIAEGFIVRSNTDALGYTPTELGRQFFGVKEAGK